MCPYFVTERFGYNLPLFQTRQNKKIIVTLNGEKCEFRNLES